MALIVNLRHYLGEDLSLIKIPPPATALREFLGCIVESVPSRDPDENDDFTELAQLSHLGTKIGGFDSASGVSFHHKTYHLAGGCIFSAAAVWAGTS